MHAHHQAVRPFRRSFEIRKPPKTKPPRIIIRVPLKQSKSQVSVITRLQRQLLHEGLANTRPPTLRRPGAGEMNATTNKKPKGVMSYILHGKDKKG